MVEMVAAAMAMLVVDIGATATTEAEAVTIGAVTAVTIGEVTAAVTEAMAEVTEVAAKG